MSYAWDYRFNQREIFEGVVVRQTDLLCRRFPYLRQAGERLNVERTPVGVGVRVTVVSERADELMRAIQHEAFPTCSYQGVSTLDGMYFSADFRYL